MDYEKQRKEEEEMENLRREKLMRGQWRGLHTEKEKYFPEKQDWMGMGQKFRMYVGLLISSRKLLTVDSCYYFR